MNTAILSTAYLAPVQYYSKLKNYGDIVIDQHEHFIKQTYRSRCDIYSPNGVLTLSIPLVKRDQRQPIKDIKISYEYSWRKLHWRSLESCYRRSPFFEYYEDDLRPFYFEKKFVFLVDLNESVQQKILELLKLKSVIRFSDEYHKEYSNANDFRELISPKSQLTDDPEFKAHTYMQVFGPRHGFIPNLSVADVLFNEGPKAPNYI